MERYRSRTIADLLKKTYKLNRPRMTPILEGKDRMQGPLDNTDGGLDFAAIQVCGICRNHLDASSAQNCCVCTRGYHSFCLEAPCQASQDPSLPCCYYCQQQAALDSNRPVSSPTDSHGKLSDDGMWRSTENLQACDEPGTSYDASEQSPVGKRMEWGWNETSPSKRIADSGGTIFTPTKTRAARKLGIRRKRIPDSSGQENYFCHVLPSDLETSTRTVPESPVTDAVQTVIMVSSAEKGGGATPISSKDVGEVKDLDGTTAPIPRKQIDLEIGIGEQLLEGCTVSPNKNGMVVMEEVTAGGDPILSGNVNAVEEMMGSQQLGSITARQPVFGGAGMVSQDCPTDCFGKIFVMPSGSPQKMQEEVRVVCPPGSMDPVTDSQVSDGFVNVAAQVVSEGDLVGLREGFLQQQTKAVDESPKWNADATHGISDRSMSHTSSHADSLVKKAMEKGTCLLMPATEAARNKQSLSVVLKGGPVDDDKVKPLIIVVGKGESPSKKEGSDELHSDGFTSKDEHMHEALPSTVKGHMEVDSSFTGPELALADHVAAIDDMKVCDICGDAGFEDMLAVCNDCYGVEHVYCYESLMAQVPEGYWQCNVCKSKQKTGDCCPSTDLRIMSSPPARLPSFNSTKKQCSIGNTRSRLKALLQKRRLPSDKKITLKGAPSSQFPAKRGLMEDALDAPPTKKQAMDSSSMSNMPPPKFGLLREASFKAPETGKVKFVSPTALIGTSGEGSALSCRGSGKLPHVAGALSSGSINSNTAPSWQTSKGRLPSASNSVVGTVNKGTTNSQLNNASSSFSFASTGSRNVGVQKLSDSVPSFLFPPKSLGSKLQPSSKGPKDTSDIVLQSAMKEGVSGQTGIANTRALAKTSSFKSFKGSEPKVKNEVSSDSARSSGPKNSYPEPGVTDSKNDDASMGRLVETACKVEATIEPPLPAELHTGGDKANKSPKHDLAGCFEGTKQTMKDEVTVSASDRSEAQISSALSSSEKDAQILSMEEDRSLAAQMMPPSSLLRQVSRISEPGTSIDAFMINRDAVQSAPLLPLPVMGVQESSTAKTEEKRSLQLSLNVDTIGEKYGVDKSPLQEDTRSNFTPRSKSFGAWGAPSYVPSLGSTRCYRCKELGHSAKDCNNRSSMPCLSPEAVGALKSVPPFSNADSTCWLKGTLSIDNATRNIHEVSPRIKPPITEMAPITKLPCTETVQVSVQALKTTVSEAQIPLEGPVMDNMIPLLLPSSNFPLDQATRKETVDCKHSAVANPVQSSTQGDLGGDHVTEYTTDVKAENDINPIHAANDTGVRVPSGALLPTSAGEGQPPLLPIPFALKNASHFPASLGPPSSVSVKVMSSGISRYQESTKVYPEAQIVWQGTFEVAGKEKTQINFHGLQANPSNLALPKVREVAKKLQPLLLLEELPRGSEHNSWPVQFQKNGPINDNIALYFFASGKESYVQYYKPLVDRLIKFDLTLKGFIEDAELLIFPSNLLPCGSRCWNNFMFLWAVFRARKLPIKQPVAPVVMGEPKHVETEGSLKLPVQSGVLSWGKIEDMQIDSLRNKGVDVLLVSGNKVETPTPTITDRISCVGPLIGPDSELVVSEQTTPNQPEIPHPVEVEAVGKERSELKAQTPAATVLPTPQNLIGKGHPLSFASLSMDGALIMKAFNESSQNPPSDLKLEEKVDVSTKLVVSSAAKLSSVLPKIEQGGSEKAKHSTPLMSTSPVPLVCSSPRDRQEDMWTSRKLSSDKDKGVRERAHDKSDRMESGRGVLRDRERDNQREREKQKERDRERERSRRHSEYEREKERERGKDRDRDKNRDRDRDRERDRDRGRDKERDRERWRDREERERRGRDWDRNRDKTGDRDKGRERGRERESERERALARERSSRHRHWDLDGDYGRTARHWNKHTRSRTPSRSPPANRGRSPSRARVDRYHHRYRRSSHHSRSYSRSPDSDHGLGRLQPRAESRDLSKDSFVQKGKSPEIKEESVVKNSAVKDYNGDEQGNYSQRGSNSNSLCRENTAGAERKLPIADLNLSPAEIEGYEEEGVDEEVVISMEVAKPLTANQDDLTSNCDEYFCSDGGPGRGSREPGECSVSAGKGINHRSTEHIALRDDRTESLSHSLINDSSGPSLFLVSMSKEGSSSCLQFFPQVPDEGPSTPDLSLALAAKERSPPQQEELPLFMQLLEPSQGSLRLGPFSSSLDVPMVSEQADLSLSLAIPEHSKRPVVNTSLRLFG